jgi:hypothetical protein
MAQFVMTWIYPALCIGAGLLIARLAIDVAKYQDEQHEKDKHGRS